MPAVSVLLPVRDGARFVGEALDSVLMQSHRDLEVLVVDDGSLDGTAHVLERAAARDRRVKVIQHDTPVGVAGALNAALRQASSPLVARMDADDIAAPVRLEQQLAMLAELPAVFACGTAIRHVDGQGRRLPAVLTTVARTARGVRACAGISTPMYHPTVVMRTEALRDRGGYDPHAPLEDLDLWLRCADRDMVNLPAVLLTYRVHRANTTSAARRAGTASLEGPLTAHVSAILGRPWDPRVARLVLHPASVGNAPLELVREAVALLDELVGAAGIDREAARDRALSTVARFWAARAVRGSALRGLEGTRHLPAGAVVRRLHWMTYVQARRALQNAG